MSAPASPRDWQRPEQVKPRKGKRPSAAAIRAAIDLQAPPRKTADQKDDGDREPFIDWLAD